MNDRWYYLHAGREVGPVTAARLRQLAASGQLEPADLVWPEGKDRRQAAPAQAAIDFSAPVDAMMDVDEAAEMEHEFLSIPWDADALGDEEGEGVLELDPITETIPDLADPAACRLTIGSVTTRGRVRTRNEDSLLVQQCAWGNREQRHDLALVVVADGMGGHQAGDRASGLVIRAMGSVLTPVLTAALSEQSPALTPVALAEALDRGLHEANRVVHQAAKDNAACKGMGSTAVALLVWDGRAFISLAGDCRVYHWHNEKLTQVTRDQTLVARMVELGQLTPQEAAKHPRRNEVTQAVGKHARIEPARYEVQLSRGDWLIANCDGLQAHVEDRLLAETIARAGPSAANLANQLIELANQGGGSDNCTVVAVHCL
ncbi:MAG TPA: GYF domain-containing protein [Gemmataceae bacterium]|nr:GYF domain-containing protein [Gemmataceae bacterium]